MQSQNRMLDDLVKMMNGAAGTIAGMGREAEGGLRDKMREWVGGMDFVARDEFEAVKAMAAAARDDYTRYLHHQPTGGALDLGVVFAYLRERLPAPSRLQAAVRKVRQPARRAARR